MLDLSHSDPRMIYEIIRSILSVDIGLFAVGITNEVDEAFLAAISGGVGVANGNQILGRDYFTAPDFQSLDTMFESISSGICDRVTPTTTSSTTLSTSPRPVPTFPTFPSSNVSLFLCLTF